MEHRPPSHDIIHAPSLEQIGFEEYEPPEGFCPLWRSYRAKAKRPAASTSSHPPIAGRSPSTTSRCSTTPSWSSSCPNT